MNNDIETRQEALLKAQKELFFAENRAWEQSEKDIDEAFRLLRDILNRLNVK